MQILNLNFLFTAHKLLKLLVFKENIYCMTHRHQTAITFAKNQNGCTIFV